MQLDHARLHRLSVEMEGGRFANVRPKFFPRIGLGEDFIAQGPGVEATLFGVPNFKDQLDGL